MFQNIMVSVRILLNDIATITWPKHGRSMARPWQDHGRNRARAWQEHGEDMARAGKDMTILVGWPLGTIGINHGI